MSCNFIDDISEEVVNGAYEEMRRIWEGMKVGEWMLMHGTEEGGKPIVWYFKNRNYRTYINTSDEYVAVECLYVLDNGRLCAFCGDDGIYVHFSWDAWKSVKKVDYLINTSFWSKMDADFFKTIARTVRQWSRKEERWVEMTVARKEAIIRANLI